MSVPGNTSRDEWRRDNAEAGLCRECKAPVKIKSNGKPAKVCATHAAADAARKKPKGT